MTRGLVVCVAVLAAAVLAWTGSLANDIAISRAMFDPVAGRFTMGENAFLLWIRWSGQTVPNLILVGLIAAAVFRPMVRRAAAMGAAAYLLGSGLLVNGVFKPLWQRPRPLQSDVFGGFAPAKPWWDWTWLPQGSFQSFTSGEASASAWMVGLALVAPAPWRRPLVALAVVYAIAISGLRVVFGAHWASDVAGSVIVMILVWAAVIAVDGALRRRRGSVIPAA